MILKQIVGSRSVTAWILNFFGIIRAISLLSGLKTKQVSCLKTSVTPSEIIEREAGDAEAN